MRNIRARRRFRALLIILLIVSCIAFFESRIEAFAPQFKVLAEKKLNDAFGGKLIISIGKLKGGVIRPFTLYNVRVQKKEGSGASSLLELRDVTSNYRIWNFIIPDLANAKPYIKINFRAKNMALSGSVTLEKEPSGAAVSGYVKLFGSEKIELSGDIKNGAADIILKPREGLVKVKCNFAADGVMILKVIASHMRLRYFDITGEATIKNISSKDPTKNNEDILEGEIEAKNLVLNYKPFKDIRASYKISKGDIEIQNLDFGRICYINGKFGLKEPHAIDAVIVTDNVNLEQTLGIFNPRYASMVQGTMNSKWELKGPAKELKSKIRLEVKKGRILDMKFEFLSADFKGDGSVITIEDSRITRESGSFVLAGYMDLTRIGKDSLFENLKLTEGVNAVLWDGYETAKYQDVREFRMKKNVIGDFDVGFKKYVNDDKVDESVRDRDEYALSYKLHPNDSITVKFKDNQNFFGLEHKDKF